MKFERKHNRKAGGKLFKLFKYSEGGTENVSKAIKKRAIEVALF